MIIPRKRCPKCSTVFEGEGVETLFSCDQCGNGYLSPMADKNTELEESPQTRLPRGGSSGSITHTRDSF